MTTSDKETAIRVMGDYLRARLKHHRELEKMGIDLAEDYGRDTRDGQVAQLYMNKHKRRADELENVLRMAGELT